jgi:hypothetical protein
VDAKKPNFFSSQEAIQRIDVVSPATDGGGEITHQVFSGGNHSIG